MPKDTIRTSLDIPVAIHRKLREAAARKGCSARQLILSAVMKIVEDEQPKRQRRRLKLDPPLIPSTGKPIDLTNEQIYDIVFS